MELNIKKLDDGVASKVSVADNIFASKYNEALIHQALVAYMHASRSGTRAHKRRSDVRGSGRKPWRQKGTGRARTGSLRNPIFRGGGVTFAATPKNYSQKLNKKMYRGAMRSIFSELVRQNRLILIDHLIVEEPKTKSIKERLKILGLDNVLIVTAHVAPALFLSVKNIPNVHVINTQEINPYLLMAYKMVLLTEDALGQIQELFA